VRERHLAPINHAGCRRQLEEARQSEIKICVEKRKLAARNKRLTVARKSYGKRLCMLENRKSPHNFRSAMESAQLKKLHLGKPFPVTAIR
jgi:hypothetical protein